MLKNMLQKEIDGKNQHLFDKDFKAVVYYSFMNQDEFLGAEIMKKLYFVILILFYFIILLFYNYNYYIILFFYF
jgi:hypothetical protein